VKVNYINVAYIKLCDGYVLIFDPLIKESIMYIEDKLDFLTKHADVLNVLLIANVKFANHNDVNKLKQVSKDFHENDGYIKIVCEKYDVKVNYIDIMNLKSFMKVIIKFLSFVYVRKSKPKRRQRNTTTLFKPVEKKESNVNTRRSYSNSIQQEDDNLCIL
jgi:hypothetical protein